MNISATSKAFAVVCILATVVAWLFINQFGWSNKPIIAVFLITLVPFIISIFMDNKKSKHL